MNRKISWLILSCLMVVSLVLASCGPAAAPEEEEVVVEEEEVEVEEEVVEEEEAGPAAEGPRYGGTIYLHSATQPLGFDEAFTIPWYCRTNDFTTQELGIGDWARGTAGTGEATHLLYSFFLDTMTGCLAEDWEIPDDETLIFNIRPGVHYHNKPPVNGRELVAEDVVYNIKRIMAAERSYMRKNHPPEIQPTSITAPDKYTVVIKVPPGNQGPLFRDITQLMVIYPPEAIEKYGDMRDWRNSVGTGPFELVDFVPMSSFTVERNPNYWMTDPFRPENQLPYVDRVVETVIKDKATQVAALRTGKIDVLRAIPWEQVEPIKRTNPGISWVAVPYTSAHAVAMRLDNPDFPWTDIRVRRALSMAIDNQMIKETLYGGYATIMNYPITNIGDFSNYAPKFEDLPKSTQELFEYHPDKAKQLMAEAGYPDGFSMTIVCRDIHVDRLSVIKQQWAKNLGVELILDVKEYGVYSSIEVGHTHKEAFFVRTSSGSPFKFMIQRAAGPRNASIIRDPWIEEKYVEVAANFFNLEERARLMREEVVPYVLDKAWYVQDPSPDSFFAWQPWLKNYHGEYSVGYLNFGSWTQWVWLDLDLKEEMIGTR